MRLPALLAAILTLVATTPVTRADNPPPAALAEPAAPPAAPDTPAGRALAKALHAFNGEDGGLKVADLAPAFLNAVPFDRFTAITAQLRAAEGGFTLESLDPGATDRALVAHLTGRKTGAPFRLRLNLDDAGLVAGLLIQPAPDRATPALKDWADLDARLAALPGAANFGAYELGAAPNDGGDGPAESPLTALHAFNADKPLAIGSTFKLWILGALADRIAAADELAPGVGFAWDAPLPIDDARKSLPSGVMQDQPAGKTFPLREFAAKMISISDNTATDHLLHAAGRGRAERFMAARTADPARNIPFVSTRELFVLKLSPGTDLAERYMKADADARRAMLAEGGDVAKARPNLAAAAFWTAPRFIDRLEWFATPQDLARTMAALDARSKRPGLAPVREILSINPGLPLNRTDWPFIGYKGGSEPGVLNLTWLLDRRDGRTFVLTLGWNDPRRKVDEAKLLGLATRAAELLAKTP